ncbi:MAG: NERD domain-containing protein/DEAD/DEAH box helicase [Pseudomonadota bacterium]
MAVFPQGLSAIDRRCDNAGERAVLHQLKRCLSDDYLVWHDVPVGPRQRQPDFVVFSPRRGLLILEVKHWALASLRSTTRDRVELATERGLQTVAHPLVQARTYALELNDLLQADPVLVHDEGPFRGKSRVPYGWGCVLSKIERRKVEAGDFAEVFPAHKTLLRDDLAEDVEPYDFEKRLWGMFVMTFPFALSLPQRDRVRWHLFPEVRVQTQQPLALDDGHPALVPPPDLMQVMDLQQEQIARTLGEGHRVIHGPAGSGKTMILIFRAQQLAAAARPEQPVLVLCYNRALAERIDFVLRERGVSEQSVVVRTFHAWCHDMVRSYQLDVAADRRGEAYFEALAATVSRSVETGLVPGGQYSALLIDEAHDFEDAWLRMATRLVSPATQSLLVLYDDAQSIYQKSRRSFSFARLGIQARGRTSVMRLNYRNTAEILALALRCAQGLIDERAAGGADDDAVPCVPPASAGRRGPLPRLIEVASDAEEAAAAASQVEAALADGVAPGDVAVLARTKAQLNAVARELNRRGIALQSMGGSDFRHFDWAAPTVKLVTLHSAKGLEFPFVAIAGLHRMPAREESLDEAARLLYVGMTRATQRLVLLSAGASPLADRVRNALEAMSAQGGAPDDS